MCQFVETDGKTVGFVQKGQEQFSSDPTIGVRLREWRKEKRLNQSAAAALGGVSLHSQHRFESGALPSTEYLLRIGEAGADWYWIVTGDHRPDALDATTSAIVTIVAALKEEQRESLLGFLRTMHGE